MSRLIGSRKCAGRLLIAVMPLAVLLELAAGTVQAAQPAMQDDFRYSAATYGDTYRSTLSHADPQARDGSRIELWSFSGRAGDCVVIQMDSDAFYPYVQLAMDGPNGTIIGEAGSADRMLARLRARLPSDGTYVVKATSAGRGEQLGQYTLSLDRC